MHSYIKVEAPTGEGFYKVFRRFLDASGLTDPLITHTYPLAKIDEAYELFENKRDGVIKVAVEC